MAETVLGEDDQKCSGKPQTVRVVGTIDRPNRAGNETEIRVESETQIAACRRGQVVGYYFGNEHERDE